MSDDGYNGWTNRETWLVNVWFNPESKADLEAAREYLDDELEKLECGCLRDMVDLGAINWRELEEHCADDEDDTDDDDDTDDEETEDEPA